MRLIGLGLAALFRMKSLTSILAALTVAACSTDDAATATLSSDSHFIAVIAPYMSPEDCISNSPDPRGCRFTLTFCKDGRAARRIADVISEGEYELIGSVAHATYSDGTSLEFDVTTMKGNSDGSNTTWIADVNNLHESMLFDTIDCATASVER